MGTSIQLLSLFAAATMKCCILGVALCLLLLQLASAHKAVPCYGITYYDCYQYCHGQCKGPECFHRCNSGCGCEEAYIIRNNGACRKLEVCQVGDDDEDPQDQDGELQLFHKLKPSDPDAAVHPKQSFWEFDASLPDRLPPPGHTHAPPLDYSPLPPFPYPPPGKESYYKRPSYPKDAPNRMLPPPGHINHPPRDQLPYSTYPMQTPGKRPDPDADLGRILPPPGHINHPPRDYLPYSTYPRPKPGKHPDPDAAPNRMLPPPGHHHIPPLGVAYPRLPLWDRPPDPNIPPNRPGKGGPNRISKPPRYPHRPLPGDCQREYPPEPCVDSEDSEDGSQKRKLAPRTAGSSEICDPNAPLWVG